MSSAKVVSITTASRPGRPVPPPLTTSGPACSSCRGAGWKYGTKRSAMRVMAHTCGRSGAMFRRDCVDCGGTGLAAAS
jgi:DnaJ-class molecular chaperone